MHSSVAKKITSIFVPCKNRLGGITWLKTNSDFNTQNIDLQFSIIWKTHLFTNARILPAYIIIPVFYKSVISSSKNYSSHGENWQLKKVISQMYNHNYNHNHALLQSKIATTENEVVICLSYLLPSVEYNYSLCQCCKQLRYS